MILSNLNDEQVHAVKADGNVMICACPGSGKTRVLTRRIAYEITERLDNRKQHVCALTYTNRAADEIKSRIDTLNIDTRQLWAGTIHTFCLEWIIRPNSGLLEELKNGFTIVDEHFSIELMTEIKARFGLSSFDNVNTRFNKYGYCSPGQGNVKLALEEFYTALKVRRKVNFDLILYYAYKILSEYPLVAKALSNIFKVICIDEYQDTQELQYDIICAISKAGGNQTKVYFVGDVNQAIYSTLGGVAKTSKEIEAEIEASIISLELLGNYRSSQRIIDYYRAFQVDELKIEAVGKNKDEKGKIVHNTSIDKINLENHIAALITHYIKDVGIKENEICVLAPAWWLVAPTGRKLKQMLPDISFDASGLSPFRKSRDNFWYRVARLFLIAPSPNMYAMRYRWAQELIGELKFIIKGGIPDEFDHPKRFLRLINSISSGEPNGLNYLKEVFTSLMNNLDVKHLANEYLSNHMDSFFESAKKIMDSSDYQGIPTDINAFRRMFKRRNGVVVNTCHGVKGEEFDVVISFGNLQGMIPNWQLINDSEENDELHAKKLLYVVSSRSKKYLHLISETGRTTQRLSPYNPTTVLAKIDYDYDGDLLSEVTQS